MELDMPTKAYYARHREDCLVKATKYHKENPDRANAASRKWSAANPEKKKKVRDAWYAENGAEYHRKWAAKKRISDPTLFMLRNAKNRAKSIGVEFNIKREDIVIPRVCPVLGLTIAKANKAFDPCSPSLDRFDSRGGYVKGNVRVISNRANILKRDGTLDEFRKIVAYMEAG